MTASRTAAESSMPIARPAASTPLKQSPAPVVSTTGTLGAGTSSSDPSGRWITAPSGPRVSMTTTPSGIAPSVERSCSLGVTYVASAEQIVRPRLRWRGVEDRGHVVVAGPLGAAARSRPLRNLEAHEQHVRSQRLERADDVARLERGVRARRHRDLVLAVDADAR